MACLNPVWPGAGGACWELWKCSPCCGDPCNFNDGLYCCFTWYCCTPCNLSKLWAHTLEQDCQFINHFIPTFLFSCIVGPIVRHNLRLKAGVGEDDAANWIGDFFCAWCCGICTVAQFMRTTSKSDWDSLNDLSEHGLRIYVEPIKMVKP
ncbi:uncharacterized protein ACA1_330540 [Acanthamoeba castellanii str. Neff]|uniref:PLAC8 family protein n=1 Tax=Acanthamoeba castellanii (strain ATCC 30010 / Neff) TaxID=1257118 RepID=L8GHB2_ACACF|nr:uncharacterized protein ACA1_330540 [Acanthamoeba castellanii str. Neff]ELR12480.1 hypothetical protein ACA1_330540 [Acanthamoeba castellanii str. Neff]